MAFTYRYTSALRLARELIEDGVIGDAASVSFQVHYDTGLSGLTWREDGEVSPGGIWFDGGSHTGGHGRRACRAYERNARRCREGDAKHGSEPDESGRRRGGCSSRAWYVMVRLGASRVTSRVRRDNVATNNLSPVS